LRNGVVVHVRDEGPRDGAAIVLCHGMLGDVAMWDAWAQALRPRYRVIRFDWPGHGLTRAPSSYRHTVQGGCALLRELLHLWDVEAPIIGGQSLGADIAWRYALAEPERVAGLILVNASGWPDSRLGYKAAAMAWRALKSRRLRRLLGALEPGPFVYLTSWMTFFPSRPPTSVVHRYRDLLLHPLHRCALGELLSGWDERPPATRASLRTLRAPVLVLHGAADLAVPAAHARAFASAIDGAELHVLAGAGHLLPMTHPAKTVALVERWLDGLDFRPGSTQELEHRPVE
jgi:pimeloyl-ACP methyl ester carboxylesterase